MASLSSDSFHGFTPEEGQPLGTEELFTIPGWVKSIAVGSVVLGVPFGLALWSLPVFLGLCMAALLGVMAWAIGSAIGAGRWS